MSIKAMIHFWCALFIIASMSNVWELRRDRDFYKSQIEQVNQQISQLNQLHASLLAEREALNQQQLKTNSDYEKFKQNHKAWSSQLVPNDLERLLK